MYKKNIFEGIPAHLPREVFSTISRNHNIRVERIVSKGHSSPPGFWYDQEQNELVILLKGKALLNFEGEEPLTEMSSGDFIEIPAHVRHRVE